MQASKLIRILSTFSSEEFKLLQKFLDTSFLHHAKRRTQVFLLFRFLKPFYPQFDDSRLKKEYIFKQLFPDTTYRKGTIEKLQSALFSLVQEFIVFQYSQYRSELHQHTAMYSFYSKKRLKKLESATIKRVKKVVSQSRRPTTEFYYDYFLFEEQVSKNEILSRSTKQPEHLPAALNRLDHYFLLVKLDLACQLLSFHQMIAPVEYTKSLKTIELLAPLLEEEYFDVPAIKVYYKAYCLLRSTGDASSNFTAFENELNKYENDISLDQLKLLNAIIRNYSVTQYHRGIDGYLSKAFSLYQKHLKKGYLYYEDKILPSTMANIVVFGLRMKAFDWVFDFLREHKNKITGTTSPEIVFQLNLANYYFYTAAYEQALDSLLFNSEDTYYRLSAKRLEIKIFYETKHILLLPRIDAFKIYIYRLTPQNISKKQKEGNRNFIDLLKQIHLPKTYQNEKRINKLITKINSLNSIADKTWLLDKLDGLR